MILVDIFEHERKLYAWLYDGNNYFYECIFYPSLHVLWDYKGLLRLQQHLPYLSTIEERKTLQGRKRVLSIRLPVREFVQMRFRIEDYTKKKAEIFHADISLEEYYFFHNDVFPGCRVTAIVDEHDRIVSMSRHDEVFEAYEVPALTMRTLQVKTNHSLRRPGAKLLAIVYNKKEYSIKDFVTLFEEENPDILIAYDTDIIFVLEKIREEFPYFSFSRFGIDNFSRKGTSFTSYGQVHFKDPPVYFKGRLHFSCVGLLYDEWSVEYPFELARLCRVPLQRMNHRSIGYGVSNAQQYHAYQKKLLIPHTALVAERWKSGQELFNADRGAMIYEPVIGFHTNVAEIDFVSLFPNIMVKYNISPETMFCQCCRGNRVPGLNMNICTKRGMMADILEPVIAQRQKYKDEGEMKKANALKGLLVCSFGYMGFRKSKLARIECHQAILAYAREVLVGASRIAEELGFTVLHGLTDSLWVQGNMKKVQELIATINEEIGLEIKLEGRYRWIVFLPSTRNPDVPVPTRYYGVFENGEIKCRGIEVRRHDTPFLVKEFQSQAVNILSSATNKTEFRQRLQEVYLYLLQTLKYLRNGGVSYEKLSITQRISKTEYKANCAQEQIVRQLKEKGFPVQPGQYIKYVKTNNGYSSDPRSYSIAEYVKLLRRAYNNLIPRKETITLHDYQRTTIEKVPLQIQEGII